MKKNQLFIQGFDHIRTSLIILIMSIFLLFGCNTEQSAWQEAKQSNKRTDYLDFIKVYPNGIYADSAMDRARYFNVSALNTGKLSLFGVDTVYLGPVFMIRPQWDSLAIRFDAETVYAIDMNGDTSIMQYFIPIELGNNKVYSDINLEEISVPGEYPAQVTWIPPVNTFTNNYNAFGTSNNRIYFRIVFINTVEPVIFGTIFHKDLASFKEIHMLDEKFPIDAFSIDN
jgi:hypothetical protein